MTIQYPDVSHRQAGLRIQPGTPALIAKVTESTNFVDSEFLNFKSQAASVGAVFGGYHWLKHGNVAAQASFCFGHCGQTPLMIDAEDTPSEPGYNGALTVDDITGFVDAFRSHGGIVHLLYLPHWYWQGNMHAPDLTQCRIRGLHLVASEYRAYSDTAWPLGYGGMLPEVWQFASTHAYAGKSVDFNAFKGTQQQFSDLINGTTSTMEDDDMHKMLLPGDEEYFSCNGGTLAFATDFKDVGAHLRVALWNGTQWNVHDGQSVPVKAGLRFSLAGIQHGSVRLDAKAENRVAMDVLR